MSDPREVEIKLELPAGDGEAVTRKNVEALGGGDGRREHLSSVYFDTPEHTLHKKGYVLRVRKTGDGLVQTVKARNRAGGGLFDRSEWEAAVPGPVPDRRAWSKTPVGEVLPKHAALAPVFETIVERTTWIVPAGQSRIEVALDRGRVVAGGETREFTELELELKQGGAGDLFDLARRLSADQQIKLGVASKSERGYALASGHAPRAFKAEPIPVERGMSAADAVRQIVHSCFRQFRLNEAVLIEKRSVDALHEARVGMRRLRSALSLFKDLLADQLLPGLKDDLRTVSRTLGEARNIDVYLDRFVRPERDRNRSEPGIVAFVDKVRTMREKAYDRAIESLNAPSFRDLTIDLLAWIEVGPWATTEDPMRQITRERPIELIASKILDKRFDTVRKTGKHLEKLDPGARHRVRIDVKKLRYAAEFFAGLTQGKAERRQYEAFIKSMKAFQELLGTLNDLHTGHDLAIDLVRKADLADPREAQLLFAAGHVSGEQDESVAALLADAGEVHAKFAARDRYWRAWAG